MIYLIVELKLQGEGGRFRGNTKSKAKVGNLEYTLNAINRAEELSPLKMS